MTTSQAEKNHPGSPLRRQKARSEGDVPRSFELAVALQVLGFTLLFMVCLGSITQWLASATTQTWQTTSTAGSPATYTAYDAETVANDGLATVWQAVGAIAPLMLGCWLVVVASHWIQTGPVFIPGKAGPDWHRVSPGNWWRQLFTFSTWSYLFVGVPKFILVLAVAAISFWYQRETIFAMAYQPINQLGPAVAQVLTQICFMVGGVLLVSSTVDYWMHYLGFEKRIRMTDQELRDETKAQDGDPAVAAQRRTLANQFHRPSVTD